MNEAANNRKQPTPIPVRRGLPKLLVGWTLLVIVGLVLVHWQFSYLHEAFNLSPDLPWIFTMLLPLVTILAWSIWALTYGRQRLVGLLLLGVPALFLTFYYPIFGGDANIVGWKPRFWKTAVAYSELAKSPSMIDLKTTTLFDYSQFLGEHRNGSVDGLRLSSDWTTTPPKLLWKHGIGDGWSGFAAVNGFAITQEQRGEFECVTCYEIETGQLRWNHTDSRRHEDTAGMGKAGPRATPTVDGGLVYVTGGTGTLECLDGSNGEIIWSVNIPKLVGVSSVSHRNGLGLEYTTETSALNWGRACSPLVYEDKVIVTAGGPLEDPENQTCTLIAFDKLTGEEIWRGGNRMVAYGSPSIENLLGKPQIVLVAESHAVGHDPDTGEELWSHERPGFSNANANCSQVTVVSDSRILLSKGYGLGGELVELTEQDGGITTEVLHKDPRILKTKLTSPVVRDGHAYALSDGFLECTEIETFQRKWKQRGRFGNGQLLLVGDKLLVHSEDGELKLIAADPSEYREWGAIPTIEGVCWNTLCLYGNRLLVRSQLEAACFELPLEEEPAADSTELQESRVAGQTPFIFLSLACFIPQRKSVDA